MVDSRYANQELEYLFSEWNRYRTWRQVWVALALAQAPVLVSPEAADVLWHNMHNVDIEQHRLIEQVTRHDVVAELQLFQRQTGDAGRSLHIGATSSDITENAQALLTLQAASIVQDKMRKLYGRIVTLLEQNDIRYLLCYARTHLQPADVTTWGNRLGFYADELRQISLGTDAVLNGWLAKGFKGSVGNRMAYAAAYWMVLRCDWKEAHGRADDMDSRACAELGLMPARFALQIPARHQEYMLLAHLSSLAAWLHKVNQDIRLLCGMGGAFVTHENGYVGSSAMPWKNNPIESEKVCSLARLVEAHLGVLWQNRANSWLERSLDDSANVRSLWPDVFTLTAHCLDVTFDVFGSVTAAPATDITYTPPPIGRSLEKMNLHRTTDDLNWVAAHSAASFTPPTLPR